jgi:hypothetical protein
MANWRAEKLDRGSQVIIVIYLDDESCGHLTFWKEQEELADEWMKIAEIANGEMKKRLER